jgi:hypothetical protein
MINPFCVYVVVRFFYVFFYYYSVTENKSPHYPEQTWPREKKREKTLDLPHFPPAKCQSQLAWLSNLHEISQAQN